MRNAYILSAIGASALVGYGVTKLLTKKSQKSHTLLEDAGIPDQVNHQDPAQTSKAEMVSEGSLYGVQYYNKTNDDEEVE